MAVVAVPARRDILFVPINYDPPQHAPFRKLLMPPFPPRSVKALEQKARDVAISLIESFSAMRRSVSPPRSTGLSRSHWTVRRSYLRNLILGTQSGLPIKRPWWPW